MTNNELTLHQVLDDVVFIKYLASRLARMEKERQDLLLQYPGSQLKRSSYVRLRERGLLSKEALRDEYIRITNKESSLSSTDRSFVKGVVEGEIVRYLRRDAKKTQ